MGHNRAGDRRRARMKRRFREENRLAAQAAQPEDGQGQTGGVVQTVKEAAKGAVEKVEGLVKTVAHKIQEAVRKE